jgi:hypothetical protein
VGQSRRDEDEHRDVAVQCLFFVQNEGKFSGALEQFRKIGSFALQYTGKNSGLLVLSGFCTTYLREIAIS